MTAKEAIGILKDVLIVNHKEREAIELAIEALSHWWHPIEEELPPVDEEGYSDMVFVSFANADFRDIGQYRTDEDGGGSFYSGDSEDRYSYFGLFVDAWMELPKRYED